MKSNIMRNELRSIRVSGDFILKIIKIYYFVVLSDDFKLHHAILWRKRKMRDYLFVKRHINVYLPLLSVALCTLNDKSVIALARWK